MTHAYAETYLADAMQNLGEAMDYAVNACRLDPDLFWGMFIAGGFADLFGAGTAKYVCGLSGTELAMQIIEKAGTRETLPGPTQGYDLTQEYWVGWVLAYYQWHTGCRFADIQSIISIKEIIAMYHPLHEASEDYFVTTLNNIITRAHPATHLKTIRRAIGYSQKMLSEKSGVSLRMIQQYEQRAKDINKASAAHLSALACALGCHMEDLMEYLPLQ